MTYATGWPTVESFAATAADMTSKEEDQPMKRFLIEREIPAASEVNEGQLCEIAQKSNAVVESLGVPYRWITSYVAGDKIYCIHEADDEAAITEHARRGGFPANVVVPVAGEFGPHTADRAVTTA